MSDAKPIAEAKKDGTAYLLFYPRSQALHGCPYTGGWVEGWWGPNPGIEDDDNHWETDFGSIGDPTHFMPLPGDPQ